MSKAKAQKATKITRRGRSGGKVLKLADLRPAPYNPRTIAPEAVKALSASLASFGDISGIVWNKRTGTLVAGHQRLAALQAEHGGALAMVDGAVVTPTGESFPVRVVDWPLSKEKLANVAANSPYLAGEFDDADLAKVLDELAASESELFEALRLEELYVPAGGGDIEAEFHTLAERFGVPPFSVLDARQGYWQERKRAWLSLGIESEKGRGGGKATPPHCPTVTRNADGSLNYDGTGGTAKRFHAQRPTPNASPGGSLMPACDYRRKKRGDGRGRPIG